MAAADDAGTIAKPNLTQLAGYFLKLGAVGFGGPVALTGAMHRDLVAGRGWVSPDEFREGMALAQLAPGPLAAQVAMYIGYLGRGISGAALIGLAFVLPSLLIVWAISAAYVSYGGLAWMGAVFYGVNATVIAIMLRASWKLAATTMERDWVLWLMAVVTALATIALEREVVWLFVAAGIVNWIRARGFVNLPAFGIVPLFIFGAPASAAISTSLPDIFWFFAQAGASVFGSGLAIVPFLYGGAVRELGWLSDQQFLDAVAVAMITPGPVVITVAFIGYLLRGEAGMVVAAMGVFLPVFLFVVLPARHFRQVTARPDARAFVQGVTAAASGALGGATVVLATRAWIDLWTLCLGLACCAVLARWRAAEVLLIGVGAAVGLLIH